MATEITSDIANEPKDLMRITKLCDKHKYDYDYLYKWSVIKGKITPYYRGVWMLSESEVKTFTDKVAHLKLEKIRKSED